MIKRKKFSKLFVTDSSYRSVLEKIFELFLFVFTILFLVPDVKFKKN